MVKANVSIAHKQDMAFLAAVALYFSVLFSILEGTQKQTRDVSGNHKTSTRTSCYATTMISEQATNKMLNCDAPSNTFLKVISLFLSPN